MASPSPRLPAQSPHCADPEAGFTLVEVLAALVIASLSIVMAFQLFVATARVSDHLVKETAARDLGRSLLASLDSGSGQSGMLFWTSAKAEVSPGLALHHVTIRWPGGPDMVFDRYEAMSKAAP